MEEIEENEIKEGCMMNYYYCFYFMLLLFLYDVVK
jgi:hypothetical protein